VSYESVVITGDRPRWVSAGSPPVPTLVLDGTPHALQHPAQAAELLGLGTRGRAGDAAEVAGHVDAVATAWVQLAGRAPWAALLEPLPRLGRTSLALAVDTFIGIDALASAFDSGWFHWPGNVVTGETGDGAVVEYEHSIVAGIAGRDDLLAFLRPVGERWRRIVLEHEHGLGGDPERAVRAPRGTLSWGELLEAQRLHAAQHYRQATMFIRSLGHPVPDLDLAQLHGLRLPAVAY
jgi:hypothetical protein